MSEKDEGLWSEMAERASSSGKPLFVSLGFYGLGIAINPDLYTEEEKKAILLSDFEIQRIYSVSMETISE